MVAASYSAESVVPAASWWSSVACTSTGSAARSAAAPASPARHTQAGAGQDEALHPCRVPERVFGRQDGAPGLPEQVHTLKRQRIDDTGQLVDEAVVVPQAHIVRRVRLAGAELVVEDDRPFIGQSGQRFQIVVGAAGPTM